MNKALLYSVNNKSSTNIHIKVKVDSSILKTKIEDKPLITALLVCCLQGMLLKIYIAS